MGEVKFGDVDKKSLIKNFNEALEDEDFNTLVNSIDLEGEDLMKYTSKLEECVCEIKNCKSCPGLNVCKNKVQGFMYYPHVQGKHLIFDRVACDYMSKVIKDEENACTYYEMPDALKHASMGDIDTSDAKRVNTIKWLKNFYDTYMDNPHQKGLYLNGSFGSGKTYLVCAMLNELAKKGVDIIVVYYPELLRSLKETFNLKENNMESNFGARMNALKKVSILFIDDIGAEVVTPWGRDEILGTILQYRMDASLPTFFTSNLDIKALEEHLSSTKGEVDKVKARRLIERIKQLTCEVELVSKNRREQNL